MVLSTNVGAEKYIHIIDIRTWCLCFRASWHSIRKWRIKCNGVG